MPVPNTFATATTSIPLSQLDANFATAITIGNTAVQLGNTITTINNTTLANTTISSGNATVTKITTPTVDAGSGTALSLQSNSTTGLYMDTSQNVGIGGAPIAGGKLDVFGAGVQRFYMRETGSTVYGKLAVNTSNFQVGTETNHALIFNTNDSERMRIDSSGNLLVGLTGGTGRLRCAGSTNDSTAFAFVAYSLAGNSLFFVRNDGAIYTGLQASSPYNNTNANAANCFLGSDGYMYRSTSSLRYKTNVQDYGKGLTDLAKLRPVTFNSKPKDGEEADAHTYAGFIAEEVHDAGLTEFVQYNSEGQPDALAYNNMVALLTKALQEAVAKIDDLSAEVTALKAKVGA